MVEPSFRVKAESVTTGRCNGTIGQPAAELISSRLYKMAFQQWQTGSSSALAYIVLIMILAITNIYVKYLNKAKER